MNVSALTSYCCTGGRRFTLPRYHVVAFCSAASLKRSTPGTDARSASESWSMAACRAVEATTAETTSTSEDADLDEAVKGNLWGFLRADGGKCVEHEQVEGWGQPKDSMECQGRTVCQWESERVNIPEGVARVRPRIRERGSEGRGRRDDSMECQGCTVCQWESECVNIPEEVARTRPQI
jgi:hypothetical protein